MRSTFWAHSFLTYFFMSHSPITIKAIKIKSRMISFSIVRTPICSLSASLETFSNNYTAICSQCQYLSHYIKNENNSCAKRSGNKVRRIENKRTSKKQIAFAICFLPLRDQITPRRLVFFQFPLPSSPQLGIFRYP